MSDLTGIKDQVKTLEREQTIEMLKCLEITKEADRICEQQNQVNTFELSQEEINECIMKEDPEHLNENLKKMVSKLQQVKKQKEKELEDKTKDLERIQKLG